MYINVDLIEEYEDVVGNKQNTISWYAIFDNLKTVDINVYRLPVAESWGLDIFKI